MLNKYIISQKSYLTLLTFFCIIFFTACGSSGKKDENTADAKNEALPSQNDEEITKLIESATDKYQKSNFDGAIEDYNKIIKLSPKNAMMYDDRGAIKKDIGDIKGAIADVKKAIELDPKNHVHSQSLADVYYADKNYKEGLIFCDKALAQKTDYDLGFYTRGRIKLAMKDKSGACADLKKALKYGMEDAQILIDENCK